MRHLRAIVFIIAALAASGVARADDRADIARATSAVVAAREALIEWAHDQKENPALGDSIFSLEEALLVPVPDGSIESAANVELALAALVKRLEPVREALAAQVEGRAPRTEDSAPGRELIDVRSLVANVPDFPSPGLGLPSWIFERPHGNAAAGSFSFDTETRCNALGVDADCLRDLVAGCVPEASLDGGFLTIKGSPAERRAAHALVDRLRARVGPRRLTLDVRAYSMDRATWASLERDGLVLEPRGLEQLAAALQQGRAKVVARETVATTDGQLSSASLVQTRTLLLPTDASAVSSVVPVTYNTGVAIELDSMLARDRASVRLKMKARVVELCGTSAARLGGVALALPELAFSRASGEVRIPPGRTAILAGSFGSEGAGAEDATPFLVAVTPRLESEVVAPRSVPVSGPRRKTAAVLARVDEAIAQTRAAERVDAIDARDLFVSHMDFAGPRLGFVSDAVGGSEDEERSDPVDLDRLETRVCSDPAWGADPDCFFQLHRGVLLIRNTSGVIERARAIVDELAARYDRQATCEASLYRVDEALARDLEASAPAGRLSARDVERFDRAASETPVRARLLAGGVASGFEEQRVHVACGRERIHLAGVARDRSTPQFSGVRSGFVLDVRVRDDAGAPSVSGRLSWVRRGPSSQVTVGDATVEAPTVERTFIPFEGRVEAGGALLLLRQEPAADAPVAIVIRPRLLAR